MPQGSLQFTPRQLLDAGRRAEAEGKLDLARQFYRHLGEHYGQTPEAAEGRHGLSRIGVAGHPQLWQMNGAAQGKTSQARAHPARPAHASTQYRVGRLLAALLAGIGWLAIVAALLALGVVAAEEFAQVPVPQELRLGFGLPILAAVAFVAGASALLLAQVARALFDQASAIRELVAMERARADDEHS